MPELLFEIFSEEIPARMQAQAAKDLERLVVGALSDRGLLFEGAKAFAGPRRLTLAITGLPAKQPDVSDEKKGPRVNAPQKAIEGFLRSAGVTLEECERRDDGKGEFYVAVINRQGRPTFEVLAELLPEAMGKLPWPKSMRWGTAGQTRWVRPLHSIIAVLDGEVVPFTFANIASGNTTRGHRFLSSGEIKVRRFEDYVAALEKAHVILEPERRKAIVFEAVKQAAFVHGLELIEDEGLLDEVSGLAEWPVVLIGRIEDQFMDVPAEILQTSMRTHQKYFSLRDPKTGKFANRFAVVANMIAEDGGKEIVAGNERVLRARLSDAKFFWDQDRRTKLADRVAALQSIVFHAKLGTQYERVQRIEKLASEIAHKIGANAGEAKRAALLCKADLTTGVVGEFPELQGVMGRYYVLNDGEPADVADAIRDHYKPLGPGDAVPANKVSVAVALADKLDQLTSFFSVGEKPTGSGDPFALRRAALGVIRIVLEGQVRLPLDVSDDLLAFFADRLKVALRERGVRHDLIDAVFSIGNENDLVRLVARVNALAMFLKSEDGANLLAGYKRAANILKVEEKRDGRVFKGNVTRSGLVEVSEKTLAAALGEAGALARTAIEKEDFVGAMRALATLRAPVDAFFDKVKVNAEDVALRQNRLELLAALRATLHGIADFSKVEG